MGFFGAVGQVISNQKNFKQWEKEDSDKQKQRGALAQRGINQAELQQAANKGKVIMDVIDIMDTHSEEVAENTETAIMPIAQSFPGLASALAILGMGKFYTMPKAHAYDEAVDNFVYKEFNVKNKIARAKYTKNGGELFTIIEKLREKAKNAPNDAVLSKIKLGDTDFLLQFMGTKLSQNDKIDAGTLTSIFNKKNMKLLSQSNDSEIKSLYPRLNEIGKEFANTPGIKNVSFGKIMGKTMFIAGGISAVLFVAANIIAAKIQVKSSRIARWQSRQDLTDPKYFVQYTDEQIKEAQKIIEANKEDEPKGFSLFKNKKSNTDGLKYSNNNSFFKSLGATMKDSKNYDKWKENYNLEDKKVKRNLTPEEIKEAEKEQEVIQRITKIINNKAEEYSENMETTAAVLIGGTPWLGLGIGALINTIMTKTGFGEKISTAKFNKLLKSIPDENKKEELKKLYESLKSTDSKEAKGFVAEFTQKTKDVKNFGTYYEKMFEALAKKDNFDAKGGMGQAFNSFKNIFQVATTTKTGRNVLIGFAGSLITGMAGAFIGLKLQKSAARAGRYKTKRELEENSENFIGYTKEDFKSVSDIKAKKKPAIQKLGEYLTFIPRVIKDYYNYEKYKNNEADYDKKLLSELTKLEVSDKQLKDAEELQRKLFTTFESVDDKSQEYSESIEAITEMTQPLLPYIGYAIAAIPLIIGGTKLYKGGAPKAAESITGFFAKHTGFLKGKTANKYVNGVAENIKGIVEKQKVSGKISQNPVVQIFESVSKGNGDKLPAEIKNAIAQAKGKENELRAMLDNLADSPAFKKPLNKTEMTKGINDVVQSLADAIEAMKQSGLKEVPDIKSTEELKTAIENSFKDCNTVSDLIKKLTTEMEIPNIKISEIGDKFKSLGSLGIKTEQIKQDLQTNNATGTANKFIEEKIQSGDWRTLLNTAKENMPDGFIKIMLDKAVNSSITNEQAFKIYQNINTILKNMPKEELQKIMDTAFEEFTKNPAKFIQALQSGELKNVFLTKGIAVTAVAAPAVWSALSMILAFTVESVFASMQKQAGRLGVMKALEELEDVRFYADMEPENNTKNQTKEATQQNARQKTGINSDIFSMFMQK